MNGTATGAGTRRAFLGAVAAAASALAGCGYRYGGGDVRWSRNAPSGLYGTDQYLWTRSHLVARSASGRRYDFERDVWTDGGTLDAVGLGDSRRSGWSFSGTAAFRVALAGGDTVYVGTDDPAVLAVRGGEERWRASLDASPVALACGGDAAYAATQTGTLHALDARSGTRRWRVDRGRADADDSDDPVDQDDADDAGDPFAGTLAADGTGAFLARVGDERASVRAFGRDGTRRWERSGVDPRGDHPPTAVDGTLYVPAEDGLVALSRRDGAERWLSATVRMPRASPRVADGTVYYSVGARLVALDAATGDRRWTAAGPVTAPALVDGRVVAGTREAAVGYDRASGERRWRVPVDGGGEAVAARDGLALVVTGDGQLQAHQP